MNRQYKTTAIAVTFIIIVGLSLVIYTERQQDAHHQNTSFQLVDGRQVTLQNFQGKTVAVLFWATTCHICISELPHLVNLYNEIGGRDFELIAVAMPYDPPNRVLDTVDIMNIPFPVAIDIESKVVNGFGGVSVTPTMVMLSPEGQILYRETGKIDMMKIRKAVTGFIKST